MQTTLTAFGWYSILKFAYPGRVRWLDILACYAASVALNGILPANLGTLILLIMFTTIIAGATFAAILGGYAVQKIFYTLIGMFVYLYLFLSVSGSFDIKFAFVHEHPWATAIVFAGGAFLLFLVARRLVAPGPEVVGPGQGGRRDPGASARIPRPRLRCRRSGAGSPAWA